MLTLDPTTLTEVVNRPKLNAAGNRRWLNTTYAHLESEHFENFSPLHDEEWNLIVDEDGPEYAAAMERFTDELTAAGWTWRRWFAAERRCIRELETVRLS